MCQLHLNKTGEKKDTVTYSSQEKGHAVPCKATWGDTRVGQEAEGIWGRYSHECLSWFLWEMQDKAG